MEITKTETREASARRLYDRVTTRRQRFEAAAQAAIAQALSMARDARECCYPRLASEIEATAKACTNNPTPATIQACLDTEIPEFRVMAEHQRRNLAPAARTLRRRVRAA